VPLRPGYHSIEVYGDGYRSSLYNLYVAVGRVHPLRAALTPLPPPEAAPAAAPPAPEVPPETGAGTLKLSVPTGGAHVFVDGEPWGQSRAGAAGFLVLPAGDHAVRVDFEDGHTALGNVRIHDRQTTALDVSALAPAVP
jgi:hypothetical protein